MLLKECFRVLLALLSVRQCRAQTVPIFPSKDFMYGKKLEGYTFSTIWDVSAKQCWEECHSRPRCGSVNYIRRLHLCELNDHASVLTPFGLTNAAGYQFSSLITESRSCGTQTCRKDQACDQTSSDCIPKECPVLSKPVNGYKKGNMNTFGSKVILGCNSGFHIPLHVCVLIGNPITSECRNNGTHAYWTVPSWTCKQGYPPEYFNGSCYQFFSSLKTFQGAQNICKENGGYLSEIETAEENAFLWRKSTELAIDNFWIGASDSDSEKHWKWVTSETSLTFKNWTGNNPDNYNSNEDCATVRRDLKGWNDISCFSTHQFVCEAWSAAN